MKSITFIGGGNMASAIIGGLVKKHPEYSIRVIDPDESKLRQLEQQFGVEGYTCWEGNWGVTDSVILAVKPQQLQSVAMQLAPCLQGALVVSIAAGIRVKTLSTWLATQRIVRVMPNTPAMVGKGVSGLYAASVSQADREHVEAIVGGVGIFHWFDQETGLDDITCVAGSGPAYVFYFVESMVQAACSLGYDNEIARSWVLATFEGALGMIREHPQLSLSQLRQNVMSKGGTTERAIMRFDQAGVKAGIEAGMMDCRQRSIEMGQELDSE